MLLAICGASVIDVPTILRIFSGLYFRHITVNGGLTFM